MTNKNLSDIVKAAQIGVIPIVDGKAGTRQSVFAWVSVRFGVVIILAFGGAAYLLPDSIERDKKLQAEKAQDYRECVQYAPIERCADNKFCDVKLLK